MTIMQIPVKGGGMVEIDTSEDAERPVPQAVYAEALRLGLRIMVNRKMTKITKAAYGNDAEAMKAAAMEVAKANVEDILTGKVRIAGQKSKDSKTPRIVMTEARRLAREAVKAELKRQNVVLRYIEAKDITKFADELLAADPSYIEAAKESLAKQAAASEAMAGKLVEIAKAIPVSAKKKAEHEKAKADAKAQLTAAKAGKIAPHMVPQRPKTAPQLNA